MITSKFKTSSLHFAAILFSAILLCIIAFYNAFPMTFNHDSGIYINSGFTGTVKEDRPIIYGLFISLFSLQYSLWLVVVTQALIVSLVVYYIFRYVNTNPGFIYYYIAFVILVALFMGAGFEVGWLMPDVFAAISILCASLLIFCNRLKLRDTTIISAISVLSISVHNTHFYICIILSLLLLSGYLFKRIRFLYAEAEIKLKKIILVMGLAILSNIISATIHNHYGGGFKSSHGGVIFLMSNLIEMGVIDPYLNENCGNKNYKLCAYKDSIPNNFLWAKNSPLKKTGGWEANKEEYLSIEKDLLTTPKYLFKIIYKSGLYTIKQFFNYDIVHAGKPSNLVKNAVEDHFPVDYSNYINSRQCAGKLNFGFINYTQNIMVGFCLFFYCLIPFSKKVSRKYLIFILFLFAGILINAWVCSTFSGVYPRYQTRVAWLMPLPLVLFLLKRGGLKSEFKNTLV